MNKLHNKCNIIKRNVTGLLFVCVLLVTFMTGCGREKAKDLSEGFYVASVSMEGGSGRASVDEKAKIQVKDGVIYATITWSSPNYDYMIVLDQKYLNEAEFGECSTFTFPIQGFGVEIPVIGDTTAMSVPHEIEYTLTFTLTETDYEAISWQEEDMLSYATQFTVQKSEDYTQITIVDSGRILLVKEDMPVPVNIPKDVTVIRQPIDEIYLVSSSVVDLFRELDALSSVSLLGIKEEDLYIEEAKQLLFNGKIIYAGKYSAPDYELILAKGCDLALENTMIYHNPQVKEKLEGLGIPVLVERSSYETHPLGRMEWIKLYGLLLGKEEKANAFFEKEVSRIESIVTGEKNGRKIAYFSVNSNGVLTVRKPGDYIATMIELCGATYALSDVVVEEENALSTMNMQIEDFYKAAKDADILIYNSTIVGEIGCMEDLMAKNGLFADFDAVKNGAVYCTTRNFFQESTGLGKFMEDIYNICNDNEELYYLQKVK